MEEHWNSKSLEKCILELVLNSLKAKASAVAVRIDVRNQRIQVVDNGSGIGKNTLKNLGVYPAKEEELTPLNKADRLKPGSLFDIQSMSSVLIIISRSEASAGTYGKFFSDKKAPRMIKMNNRPTGGTTVTIYASKEFFNWNRDIDSFAIRCIIVYLALVNRQVSFSVRDDWRGSVLLRIGKHQKCRRLLRVICEQPVNLGQIHSIKIRLSNKIKIAGFWGFECSQRKIHQVLLNLRPVRCSEIENLIIRAVTKICYSRTEKKSLSSDTIFFLLYIKSPESEYSFSVKNGQFDVEFHKIDRILHSIKKFLRITFSKKLKPSKISISESTVTPMICRPIGRIPDLKRRRTSFTKITRHSFEKNTIPSRNKKAEAKDSEDDNYDKSFSSEKCIEKSPDDIGKEKSQIRTPDATPAAKVSEPNNPDSSWMSNKSIGKLRNTVKPRQDSQRIDQDSSAKKYQYDNHGVLWISQKCVEKISNSVEEKYTISDCSQWSNWTYEPGLPATKNCNGMKQSEVAHPAIYKRFRFLPLNLHALLPFKDAKFISRASLENDRVIREIFNLNFKHRRQDLEVRPCTRRSIEVRLKLESLQSMKVLNQVNHEFIVALTKQDEKKLLVIIDQHAMDERIRYENLLRAYRRDKQNEQFTSVTLHRPIIISDLSPSTCNLLSANERLLARYGLRIAFRNENTLLVLAVPRCFRKKTYRADNTEIETVVRKLLQEVLDSLNSNGIAKFLPFTIHDAIASEACHGAIKFGDPLTVKQCESLVSCWKETEAPNRCAHGRPSVIPLLELSTVKCDHERLAQEKLNFASLRNPRRTFGKMHARTVRYNPYVRRAVREFEEF